MNSGMKKKVLTAATIVICLAILGTGTLAYFTESSVAHNVISAGGVTIDLVETKKDGSPFEDLLGVMPGTSEEKIAYIKNVGDADAYVRIKLITTVKSPSGEILSSEPISYQMGSSDWTKVDDYYYYGKPLAPKASTGAIIEGVAFASSMGNNYEDSTVTVKIEAEAVQAANNGTSVLTAAGWPVETP